MADPGGGGPLRPIRHVARTRTRPQARLRAGAALSAAPTLSITPKTTDTHAPRLSQNPRPALTRYHPAANAATMVAWKQRLVSRCRRSRSEYERS